MKNKFKFLSTIAVLLMAVVMCSACSVDWPWKKKDDTPPPDETPGPVQDGEFSRRFFYYDTETGTEKVFETTFDPGDEVVYPDDVGDFTFKSGWRSVDLVFQGWNHDEESIIAADNHMDIGAMYITASGNSVAFITVSEIDGMEDDQARSIFFYVTKNLDDILQLNVFGEDGYYGEFKAYEGQKVSANFWVPSFGTYIVEIHHAYNFGESPYSFGQGTASTVAFGGNVQGAKDFLTHLFVGKNVVSIGNHAFNGCSSLTTVILPEGVTGLGTSTFSNCSSLEGIVFPNGILNLGGSAFTGCISLKTALFSGSIVNSGIGTFNKCSSLVNLVLPNNLKILGNNSFQNCEALESIVIPEGVTSSGIQTFRDCYALAFVEIPNSLTQIGSGTFYGCISLTSITIPDSVTQIGNTAFANCFSITEFIIKVVKPPNIGSTVFYDVIAVFFVPDESIEAYKTASYWDFYADLIFPLSERSVAA